MFESSFVPVSELPNELSEHDRVAWQVNLGPNEDGIFVSPNRIRRIARVAGLSGVTISQFYGEQSEGQVSNLNVSDISQDGSATGAAEISKAKTNIQKSDLDSNPEGLLIYWWSDATISIDRTELGSRVSDARQKGFSRKDAMANQLDTAIRSGLRASAYEKIRSDANSNGSGVETFFNTAYCFSVAPFIVNGDIDMLATGTLLCGAFQAARYGFDRIEAEVKGIDFPPGKRRISAFPSGIQFDRFVAASLMSYATTVVKSK